MEWLSSGTAERRFRTGDTEAQPPVEAPDTEWLADGVDEPHSCGGSYFVDVAAQPPLRQWEVRVGATEDGPFDVVAALDGAARIGGDRCWVTTGALADEDDILVSARDIALDGELGEWGPWLSLTAPDTCGCGGGGGGAGALPLVLGLLAGGRRRPGHPR